MALTLKAAITVGQTTFDVLGADDLQPGDFKTIDSETVVIRTAKPATLGYGEAAQYRVSVYRGAGGTRAAAHAAAAELATYSAGGEGGGVTVDNTVDAPEEVTSIVAAGAVIAAGEATLRGKDFYAQDTDPGVVGTGSVWKDTSAPPYLWYERNDADDGWDAFVRVTATATGADTADVGTTANSVDGGAIASSAAEATGDGGAGVEITAISVTGETLAYQSAVTVDGVADAHAAATATGTGTADTSATSTTLSGDATSGIKAVRDGVEASVLVDSTDTTVRVRAVATDITLTATDDITLDADGDIGLNPLVNLNLTAGGDVTIGGDLIDLNTAVVMAASLPAADPEVAGQLYTAGAPGPGAPVALMVSGGAA